MLYNNRYGPLSQQEINDLLVQTNTYSATLENGSINWQDQDSNGNTYAGAIDIETGRMYGTPLIAPPASVYVLRYRMRDEILYQYIIGENFVPETPEGAVEYYVFGPFASKQEASEFIEDDQKS